VLEMARFTDNARAAVKTAFRSQPVSTEHDLIAALTKRNRGVAIHLLAETGVTIGALPANAIPIERRWLLRRANEIARQRGVNYVGTEHLLIAIAGLPNSGLAAKGVSAERLGTMLSLAEAKWKKTHPPIARRVGAWCRSVVKWVRRGA
jgi:hypothetical protein